MRKPSPGTLIALVALFVALGGIAWAATKLPKDSVKAKQIAKNAVRGPEVKNASLSETDFKGGLPRGPEGQQGPAGRSALQTLQGGETVRGTWALASGEAVDTTETGTISLPIPAPAPIGDDDAHFAGPLGELDPSGCSGSAANPTAAPGEACVYFSRNQGVSGAEADGVGGNASAPDSPYGFVIYVSSAPADDFVAYGTWAYTARDLP